MVGHTVVLHEKGDTMNHENEKGVARLTVSNDSDLPITEMQALSAAFEKQGTVVTMLVLTTLNGHALLTTKNREEKLVEYPLVGRQLVQTLREYADNLSAQLDLNMTHKRGAAMPRYKVELTRTDYQYASATVEVDAIDERHAKAMARKEDPDWDWGDSEPGDVEVQDVEEIESDDEEESDDDDNA